MVSDQFWSRFFLGRLGTKIGPQEHLYAILIADHFCWSTLLSPARLSSFPSLRPWRPIRSVWSSANSVIELFNKGFTNWSLISLCWSKRGDKVAPGHHRHVHCALRETYEFKFLICRYIVLSSDMPIPIHFTHFSKHRQSPSFKFARVFSQLNQFWSVESHFDRQIAHKSWSP